MDSRPTDINILLLGETGVGKSTFINSFANYVQYETMADALDSDLVCLIPTNFTIPDEEYNEQYVRIGCDKNENQEIGNSSTQGAKSYIFPMEGDRRRIRLIDTPGIGDARGVDQDNINFENILSYLSQFDHLHAICFLLKPNVSILTAYFKFCILHLLSRLEKSAVHNIVFVFTNTRSTLYRPGETLTVLRRVLREVEDNPPHVSVPCDKKNMFCMDNEAFRFLVALKNDFKFTEAETENFAHSWQISVETCRRMLDYIAGDDFTKSIKPHPMRNTLSVNDTRRVINDLTKPLVDISDMIEDNLTVLSRHEKDIDQDNMSIEDFKNNLYVPVIDLVQKELTQPVTVCTEIKCAEKITISGITKYHYKQRCHNPCYLRNVPREVVGSPELLHCWAMRGQHCHVCGCHFSSHMHILYETETVNNNIIDASVQTKITTTEQRIREQKKLIDKLRIRRREYEIEKDIITKTMAKFVHFIKEHSVSFYNDAYEEYLDYLIARETNLGADSNRDFVKRHEDLKKQYQEERRLLDSVMNSPYHEPTPTSVSTAEIRRCVGDLYNLKHTGKKIKNLHKAQEDMRRKEHSWSDEYQHVKPIKRGGKKKKPSPRKAITASNVDNAFKQLALE